jgi:hypothetical protein
MKIRVLSLICMTAFAAPAVAATPPGAINMVVAGAQDPNGVVPAFNIAPGAGVTNLSIAIPQATIVHGDRYVYWVSFEDFSFTGTCTISYQLSQVVGGKKKILLGQKILAFSCSPGLWGAAIVGKAVPNSPGIGTLTGIVAFGATKERLSTTINIQ